MTLWIALALACTDPDAGRGPLDVGDTDGGGSDGGTTDGGGTDGGTTDGGGSDGGGTDSGTADGGGPDGGGTDSGSTTDGGGTDGGGTDSGEVENPEDCPPITEWGTHVPPAPPVLLSPEDGAVVDDTTPTLTAQPCPDPDDGGDIIVTFAIGTPEGVEHEHSDPLDRGGVDPISWTPTRPLDIGQEYCWTAWATDPDGNHSFADEGSCLTVE